MRRPTLSIIAAMDEKGGIGKDNRIPWHIHKDLVRLKEMTKDHLVILGRNSYDSMVGYYDKSGRPMPAKKYIVITRNKNFKSVRNNIDAVYSIEEALDRVNKSGEKEMFVIGGETIYKQMLEYTDRLYLTIVKGKFDCDTFFPDYSDFKKVISEEIAFDEGFSFTCKVLEK